MPFDEENKHNRINTSSSNEEKAKSVFGKVSPSEEKYNSACGELSLLEERPMNTFVEFPQQRTVQCQLNRIAKSEN